MTSLLAIDQARIEAGGGVLAEALSLALTGPRVVIVGDGAPVLWPLLGLGNVTQGAFLVGGQPLEQARPSFGLCPFDVMLPLDDTPLAYVTWSARLAGLPPREADAAARLACGKSGMGDLATQPMRKLGPLPRRLAVLAHATVIPGRLLVAESPLVGFDAAGATYLLAAMGRLAGDRPVIVSTPRFEAKTPAETLARGGSQVVVLVGGKVLESGPPSAIRTLWPAPAEVAPAPVEELASDAPSSPEPPLAGDTVD